MKKKILFISSLDTTGEKLKYDGVMKKLLYQIQTLAEMGYEVDYIKKQEGVLYLCNLQSDECEALINQQSSFYRTMKELFHCLDERVARFNYDYVYMRYVHLSWTLSRFFKHIKKHHPNVISIAELPTYMGKWEPGASLPSKIKFIVNRFYQIVIPLNVDRVVTFSNHKRLFGIKTIQIENFADVSKLPLRNPTESNDFHMMGVAMMTPSHGYDRVIKGLNEYYKTNPDRKVYFHIIGKGYVVPAWQQLVKDFGLEDYVIFEGLKSADELNEYFDKCQIAVATLAIFRKKCPKASELKIREYTARGIPFIYSACEPQFDGQPFCLKEPHDESPINIYEVISFYEKLDNKKLSEEMRAFAIENCTCLSQFKIVFDNFDK